MIALQNICIRDKEGMPKLFFDGLFGTMHPFSEGIYQIKLDKIFNGFRLGFNDKSGECNEAVSYEDELNIQKSIDKELFLKYCEALYDMGSFSIYSDLAILTKGESDDN